MTELTNTERLPEDVKKIFLPYLERMRQRHEDNLTAVFIYGSAAGGNYVPKVSDINSAFIFRRLDFPVFQRSLDIVADGRKKNITAPLFLTADYIRASLDVFPMEFLEMKENHVLLFGEDLLSGLDIKGEHIRLFCEQQIKGKLVRIRQAYLEVGQSRRGMEQLLKDSLRALLPVFRNLVRLKGQPPAVDKEEVLRQLCAAFQLDEGVFLPVYRDKTNDEKIAGRDVVVFIEKMAGQLEKLAGEVDRL
jgi:hypothetical protein